VESERKEKVEGATMETDENQVEDYTAIGQVSYDYSSPLNVDIIIKHIISPGDFAADAMVMAMEGKK
jgi:hypothetical protein